MAYVNTEIYAVDAVLLQNFLLGTSSNPTRDVPTFPMSYAKNKSYSNVITLSCECLSFELTAAFSREWLIDVDYGLTATS